MSEPADTAYVAFVDVLGFSNFVESEFDRIVEVYDQMLEGSDFVQRLRADVSLDVFSDAFILRSPRLGALIGAVQGLLMVTLGDDLMVRGGIGFGRYVEKHKNGRVQVVSQALVRAVKVERQVRHPCVVLDPAIDIPADWWRQDVPNQHRGLLYFDGLRIVNPCNIGWGHSAAMRVIQLKEAYPQHAEKHDWFLRLWNQIMSDRPMIPPTVED